MESLLANYASSDEEGGGRQEQDDAGDIRTSPPPSKPFSTSIPSLRSSSSPLFSSLPPPKSSSSSSATSIAASSSSSLFGSLPPPKASSSSIFSSLRPPRSTTSSSSSSSSSSSLFGSLPPPNASSSSIFSSLPPPRSTTSASSPSSLSSSSSSLFSSLPPPKSQQPKPPAPSEPTAKKVVQFRPPIDPSLFKPRDDDDEEDSGRGKRRIQDFSSKPLSSIIPAPKNTLGLGASSRRSVIEADVPAGTTGAANAEEAGGGSLGDQESFGEQWAGRYASIGADGQADSGAVGGDVAAVAPGAGSYDLYGGYGSYEGYDNYGSYGRHWDYGSSEAGAASAVVVPESARTSSKRGRDEIPSEILEVKQDELIKNRPREDQVRLTGIAFGPAYQPAPSAKGKPSKLHKRKHQIGALYYDMRQKEMELAERRAKGFLTKKETQAKYGW